jgi:N,N-dimethylformamidase
VLAAATGFSDLYQHVIDEVLESDSQQGGTVHPDVRADMVLVQHDNGGAVFSPGSITWCSCLSADRYRGSVSRVTENVLRRFLEEEPLPGAEG